MRNISSRDIPPGQGANEKKITLIFIDSVTPGRQNEQYPGLIRNPEFIVVLFCRVPSPEGESLHLLPFYRRP